MPVGEEARPRSRPAVTGGVAPVAVGEVTVAVSAMPVAVGVMPVAMTVGAAGVAVMPVRAWMNPVSMEVAPMGVPVVSVGVPRTVVRPGWRRGVGMGHREEGHERPEREPRDRIAAPVPVVVSPPRLGGAGNGEHGHESEYQPPHRSPSRTGNRRTPRNGANPRRLRLACIVNPIVQQSSPPPARQGRPLLLDPVVYTIVRDAD